MIANIIKSSLFLLLTGSGLCAVLKGEDPSGPLFLTPYIQKGLTEEGRDAAKVAPLVGDVESYSGFLTVDEKLNKNLFFWYFPAESKTMDEETEEYNITVSDKISCNGFECSVHHEENIEITEVVKDETPVVLWLQGGLGVPSTFGLLKENGPYQLMDDLSLELREQRWSKSFHMLYIDSPVGTGFSFGNFDANENEVSEDLYNALLQFFELFPDLDGNNFFIAGESYAGRFIPALGLRIHEKNPSAGKRINLAGLMIGNGMVDDEFMVYGDYLAQHGLIDLQDLPDWQGWEETYIDALKRSDCHTAYELANKFKAKMEETGVSVHNFLETKTFDESLLTEFFNEEVKQKIHAGDLTFKYLNGAAQNWLSSEDFSKKTRNYTEKLLENYRVMHYNGQLDILYHYPMADAYTNSLEWTGSEKFREASKNRWVVGQELAGYVQSGGNLYLVMVRNAGQMVPMDQPEWAFDLVSKFVQNNL